MSLKENPTPIDVIKAIKELEIEKADKTEIPAGGISYEENTAVDSNAIDADYMHKVINAVANNIAALDADGNAFDSGINKDNIALKKDIPTIPTSLKNPQPLTINNSAYDGSSAVSLNNMLQSSALSLAYNGYIKLTNGLIIQWVSVVVGPNDSHTCNFTTAFSSACYCVAINHQIASKDDTDNMSITAWTTSSFTLWCGHSQNTTVNIIAIGK